jgi:hypothetical protein
MKVLFIIGEVWQALSFLPTLSPNLFRNKVDKIKIAFETKVL